MLPLWRRQSRRDAIRTGLLARVCERAAPQVETLLVSRNGGDSVYNPAGFELLPDKFPGEGPPSGVLAGLSRVRVGVYAFLVTFSCDTPFVSSDPVARLREALFATDAGYCIAWRSGDDHRAIALWRVHCMDPISTAFVRPGAVAARTHARRLSFDR